MGQNSAIVAVPSHRSPAGDVAQHTVILYKGFEDNDDIEAILSLGGAEFTFFQPDRNYNSTPVLLIHKKPTKTWTPEEK